jgi:hypothetical protein
VVEKGTMPSPLLFLLSLTGCPRLLAELEAWLDAGWEPFAHA